MSREEAEAVEEEEDIELPPLIDDNGSSYWDNPINHLRYLSDASRFKFFYKAISSNQKLIKDKVVIDAGCGVGSLSILLAKAGARHVIAVEQSEAAAEMARRNIEVVGLSQKITVLIGRIEDITIKNLPGQEKADLLVHDGCGPLLLSGLLRGVMAAKRRLLKPDGALLPSHARVHCAGVEDRDFLTTQKELCQGLVPGIDLSPGLMTAMVSTPRVSKLDRSSSLFTNTSDLLELDLNETDSIKLGAGGFSSSFELRAERDERLMALVFWTSFSLNNDQAGQGYDGGPGQDLSKPLLFLNFPKSIRLQKGESITGSLSVKPLGTTTNSISMNINFQGSNAQCSYVLGENLTEV